jgi:cytochrome c5
MKLNHRIATALMLLAMTTGCGDLHMRNQGRYEPYEESDLFENKSSARPLVEGVVARGSLQHDDHLYKGKVDGKFVEAFPYPVTREVLERGKNRYEISCMPCHDLSGYGKGMVVRRGFNSAQSFHSDRLRNAPVGYLYHVITNGFGSMPSYRTQILTEDRWAIVAYVRALQLSQHAKLKDVPVDKRKKLK